MLAGLIVCRLPKTTLSHIKTKQSLKYQDTLNFSAASGINPSHICIIRLRQAASYFLAGEIQNMVQILKEVTLFNEMHIICWYLFNVSSGLRLEVVAAAEGPDVHVSVFMFKPTDWTKFPLYLQLFYINRLFEVFWMFFHTFFKKLGSGDTQLEEYGAPPLHTLEKLI